MLKNIETKTAPAAIGPYSQAILTKDFLFISGQIPLVPETGDMVSGSIEEQTKQVMLNLEAILRAAGLNLNNLVKTTIYLKDMNDFAVVNKIYAEYLGSHKPARATIAVSALPKGALVEIDGIAVIS
ncbi:MAG: RidA family protein [Spirochaetia bacterium]|nr:RidA family protein [Spirochaetia bacterium]